MLGIADELSAFHGEIQKVTSAGNAALSGKPDPSTLTGAPALESPAASSFNFSPSILNPLSSPAFSLNSNSNYSGARIEMESTPPSQKKRRFA